MGKFINKRRGKMRNGLYLRTINIHGDRIEFKVYASRPLGFEELGDLRLTDNAGTEFKRVNPDEVIDGKGSIVFTPAPPDEGSWQLSGPGWGMSRVRLRDPGE